MNISLLTNRKRMKTKRFMSYAFAALMLTAGAACSDSTSDEPSKGGDDTAYIFGTDGGNVSCDHVLFDEAGKEAHEGNVIGNGDQNFVFKGTQTLKKGTYILKGWVYIADGSTLTLEPGTIIKGDKKTKAAIIAERGGKLIAKGTATQPIIFTSNEAKGNRKPGDWGGVILCGKAPNNQSITEGMMIEGGPRTKHGGSDVSDNSGVLSYVRVEFAGYPFETDKEINGITFGSVGKGTQIDHVQVSYSNDDSFEWFGGSVNCKYLVAYKGWDDDFDTDNGFSGNVQYGLVIRDPKIADKSQSNGFESDNCADGAAIEPYTTATFSNITFVGPMAYSGFQNTTDYINGGEYKPENLAGLGKFQAAMQIRRSSRLNCFNSVAIGFPIGVIIDGEKGGTVNYAKEGKLNLQNIWLAGMGITGSDANKKYDDYLLNADGSYDSSKESFSSSYFKAQTGNKVLANIADINFKDGRNIGVQYMPSANSGVLTAASFTDAILSNGFDKVSYVGAFGTDDSWLEGWTNFDPNNTEY